MTEEVCWRWVDYWIDITRMNVEDCFGGFTRSQ